ncbi:MAG: hypothetical protein ACRDSL_08770 [Pseudonocardiaceae bacterium]
MAPSRRPTAQPWAETAPRVADTYPELLTSDEFNPTLRSDEDDDELAAVRHLPVPSERHVGVSSLLGLPAAAGRSACAVVRTTAALVALPGRVVGLVTLAEQTLTAMHTAVTRTTTLLDRVEAVTHVAEGGVQAASRAVTTAAEQASALTTRTAALLEGYIEPLRRLQPIVRQLAETTEPGEIDALVALLDRLPQLADAMEHEVIPLLGHLDQVGPDVNQLLDSVAQLNRMASRLPKVFRRHHFSQFYG